MPKGVYTRTDTMRVKNQTGEKNHMWKGNDADYHSKHKWINVHKGRPKLCEHCGTTTAKRYEWASVSKKHERDLDDYIRLCSHCHHIYDDIGNKIWASRRKNGTDGGYKCNQNYEQTTT